MLSSCCSHSLSHYPILATSLFKFRVPNRPGTFSFTRSSRIFEYSPKLTKKKWKISCFRHEGFPPENPKPEHIEHFLPEDLVQTEFDKSSAQKRDWKSTLKEAADAVLRAVGSRWTVPWTAKTILQVMLLWVAAFWFIGSWVVPFAAHMAGFSKESLTFRGQALFSLVTDLTEGLAGIAILHRCLSQFQPLPSDWFKFSLRGKWLFDVALGCLMFPLVNRLSQFNLNLLPLMPSTPVTLTSVEQSILARDPVAMALYAIVVSICAPVWEEIVFRENAPAYFPRNGDGCCFCAVEEFIAIYASAQPLERLRVLGSNEINILSSNVQVKHMLQANFLWYDLNECLEILYRDSKRSNQGVKTMSSLAEGNLQSPILKL
ncbi:hypothetical protein V6N11_084247 [Hibiscus sabdariffa]|uniref:Uncharacterized protein n=1 Tax=Hibiscus sabdariffa TaxID=183260 RepID=A0ABR2QSL0_9ROSI